MKWNRGADQPFAGQPRSPEGGAARQDVCPRPNIPTVQPVGAREAIRYDITRQLRRDLHASIPLQRSSRYEEWSVVSVSSGLSETSAVPTESGCVRPEIGSIRLVNEPEAASSRRGDRLVRMGCILAALLAHGLILHAMSRPPDDAFGAGGQVLEAIGVEIVTASAIESRTTDAGAASASAADVADAAGVNSASAAASAQSAKQEERKPASADTNVAMAQLEKNAAPSAEDMATVANVAPREAPRAADTKPEETSEAREPKPSLPQEDLEASIASVQGGASARGNDASTQQASAAAAASPGAAREYAKAVVTALSRTKPKAPGGSGLGTVRISFVIGLEGTLADVRIARSSGRDVLDNAALDAVRRARFPAPPFGLSSAQLTYEVPYHFR